MNPLDLESMLAAIGPAAIFAGKPKLTKQRLVAAAEMPKEIRRQMLKFLSTSEFTDADDYPKLDYDEVLELVSTGQTPEQAHALFAAVPDHELATDLGIAAGRILTWANTALPRETRDTVAGPQQDEPAPKDLADFARTWEVALNPMVIMRDLAEGCLSDDQVAILSLLYPSLYAEMRQAIVEAATTMAARMAPAKWEPSPMKSQLIAVLRGEPDGDPAMSAVVQTVYSKEPDQSAAPPKPHRPSGSTGDAGSEQTPGQAAGAGV